MGPLNVWVIRLVVIGAALRDDGRALAARLRTKLGKAMRATAYDREAAAMMGIDVDRVIVKTFFIGSALAGAAGVLVGLVFGSINHFMGFNYGLKGFTAAVVGGIGSIPGRCSAGCSSARGGALGRLHRRLHTRPPRERVQRPHRVPDPRRVHAPAPAGHLRQAGGEEGLEHERGPTRAAADRRRRVGRERGGRRARSLAGRDEDAYERTPAAVKLLALAPPFAVFPLLVDSDYLMQVGVDTLIFVLLALGLNVAVGWVGLLDLGFVAFFGLGAYLYAALASEYAGRHWERSSPSR